MNADALFIDNGSILTSGGVTSGVDLALHILRADVGSSVANHVASRIVMAPHRDGRQAQFIETPPVPLSPMTDLTVTGRSYTGKADVDPAVSARAIRTRAADYLGDTDPADPLVSPIFATSPDCRRC